MLVTEKVSLDHSEILEGLASNFELDSGPDIPELEELRRELVPDEPARVGVIVARVLIPVPSPGQSEESNIIIEPIRGE